MRWWQTNKQCEYTCQSYTAGEWLNSKSTLRKKWINESRC